MEIFNELAKGRLQHRTLEGVCGPHRAVNLRREFLRQKEDLNLDGLPFRGYDYKDVSFCLNKKIPFYCFLGQWCLLWKPDWLYACAYWSCWSIVCEWRKIIRSVCDNRRRLNCKHKSRLQGFGKMFWVLWRLKLFISGKRRYCSSIWWWNDSCPLVKI